MKAKMYKVELWARGYFAASTGNVTDEIIRQYIETQKVQDENDDDDISIGSP
jgi:putative transposase